jgi:hypothetical protein
MNGVKPTTCGHFGGRHSLTPWSFAAIGEIHKWASGNLQLLEMRWQNSAEFRGDARANARGVPQISAVVIADQDGIKPVPIRDVTAKHESLTTVGSPFDPIAAALMYQIALPEPRRLHRLKPSACFAIQLERGLRFRVAQPFCGS